MTGFLLDTNVLSELRKAKNRIHPNVKTWAESANEASLYISVISLHEIEVGILKVEANEDPLAPALRHWFENKLIPAFENKVFDVSADIALRAAPMQLPVNMDIRDAFLAATALENKLTVVTRNTKDFAKTGVKLLNPWLE